MKVEDVVRTYVAARDEMRAKKAEYDKDLAARREKLEKIEAWLLREADKQGVNGFNTSYGVCFKTKTVSATIQDREAAIQYATANNAWAMLTVTANKQVLRQIMDADPDHRVPPGLKYVEIDNMSVRKPTAS